MPFKIQRNPRGLNDLLSIAGGVTPTELEDRARLTLESLQFYGMSQRRVIDQSDPAVPENGAVVIPALTSWIVLFCVSGVAIKTGTMTALRLAIGSQLNGAAGSEFAYASQDMGPFGATETGAASLVWWAPYPLVLPPRTTIFCRAQILGTDATVSLVCGALVGVLG